MDVWLWREVGAWALAAMGVMYGLIQRYERKHAERSCKAAWTLYEVQSEKLNEVYPLIPPSPLGKSLGKTEAVGYRFDAALQGLEDDV